VPFAVTIDLEESSVNKGIEEVVVGSDSDSE
jgi:hypothetical protein